MLPQKICLFCISERPVHLCDNTAYGHGVFWQTAKGVAKMLLLLIVDVLKFSIDLLLQVD
jgi:hypothetical protein